MGRWGWRRDHRKIVKLIFFSCKVLGGPRYVRSIFARNKEKTERTKTGERGDKESSMTTQSHAPHTHAHRGLLVCAGLSGKLDLKADNF